MSPTISNPRSGLEHLTQLNPSVYLYAQPSSSSSSSSSSPSTPPSSTTTLSSPSPPSTTAPPTLILLLPWMSAPPRPISKYVATYTTIYPSTPLLVLRTSSINAVYHTRTTNLARITPVLEYLLALPPDARILLHLFSNGGAFTTTLLLEEYTRRVGRVLGVEVMVLDSAPGRARLLSTVQAFMIGLPPRWRKYKIAEFFMSAVLAFLFTLYKAAYFLSGWILMRRLKGDLVTRTRQRLNDKSIVDVGARRLYVYSEGDELVHWRDVEEHAAEAEGMGWCVRRERFGRGSGHVGHVVGDGGRYWGAIQREWEDMGE